MKTVVVYYSGKGSNRFLAGKAAEALDCDLVELRPRIRAFAMLATMTKLSFGNKASGVDFSSFERVLLCGPLYVGNLAAPCNDFIKKYGRQINKIDVITCCGSTDEKKDDKFGYDTVFKKLRQELGGKLGECEAFPIELVLTDEQKDDDQAMMNTRLSEGNFTGKVKERLDAFVLQLNKKP